MATSKKRWLPNTILRTLAELGWTNRDIALANEEATGWQPSVSGVTRKLQSIGVPDRRMSHKDLIFWTIRPEHAHDPIYYGLQAIDKERKGIVLSPQDQSRAKVLRDILTQHGRVFVVDYQPDIYPERGFVIVPATEKDTDIVRRPNPVNLNHDHNPEGG